ncbi:MAG: RsmB/NOP family class I SAM-dependent RNA methyltransferase [Formosimonas sp.]
MSDVKVKKSYSKKPSKKERLQQELAQKQRAEEQKSRVESGGVYIRPDGVAVSAAALAARRAALGMAQEAADIRPVEPRKVPRTRSSYGQSTIEKIAAPSKSGERLAQCLWRAQILLVELLKFDAAADKLIAKFLREHKELGARDRHIVAETVYAVLRQRRIFAHLAQTGSGALERRLTLLGAQTCVDATALAGAVPEDEMNWLRQIAQVDVSGMPAAVRSNLSDDWFAALSGAYGEAEAVVLAQALNQTAPLDIRVNTLKSSREAVKVALDYAGVAASDCPFSPQGVRLAGKPALQKLDLFQTGAVEVQDEGSQLLTLLLGAKRGEMVADFCAGAGGKTLAIGAMMKNTGRLYAMDVAGHRLAKLKPRLARSGLSNVQSITIESETDARVKRLYNKLDRVFIDAPCSGLGTLRRNPDLKWRHSVDSVARLATLQASILESAARLVKIGGTVVYATCSVLPDENQNVVQAFLAANPNFEVINVQEALAVQNVSLPDDAVRDGFLQLLPHLHHTDGFFAACLKRVA